MKIGIMQPYFLPYIGYWQLLNAVDKYVIYDDVNYIKGGWINRNRIIINDKVQWMTLRLNGASPNKLINEIELANDISNTEKLLRKILETYRKAPYFNEIYPIIEKIIRCKELNLTKYLENSIKVICEYLEIGTEIILSSTINKNNDLRAEEKVIEICKKLHGNEYYNAIGGKELYSYENFSKNGIKLRFLKANLIEYKQKGNNFIQNLSILDVLMCNSKEEIQNFLKDFTLEGEKNDE